MGFYEDLTNQIIAIYPGKNDGPRAATAARGGNASDLVHRFNNLVAHVRDKFTSIDSSVADSNQTVGDLSIAVPLLSAQFDLNHSDIRQIQGEINDLRLAMNALEAGLDLNARTLTAATTWYVDGTNGLDTNDGLAVSTAVQSLTKASRLAAGYANPSNFARTIHLMPGIHNGGELAGYLPFSEYDRIIVSSYDPENLAIIQGLNPIQFSNTGIYELYSIVFKQSDNSGAYIVANNAKLKIGDLRFEEDQIGGLPQCHILGINKADIEIISGYSISASAYEAHIILDFLSTLYISHGLLMEDEPIKIGKSVNFDEAFVVASKYSYLNTRGVRFELSPGSVVTGKRFIARNSSTVDTGTSNLDNLPGSLPGVLETNSFYY